MTGAGIVPDYEFDVFISYRHSPPVGPFVTDVLFTLFEGWLTEALDVAKCRVCIDATQMGPGDPLPATLASKLRVSRCLLAICSPSYFRSPWCLAEWVSFRERERMCGGDLIVPLLFDAGGQVLQYVGQTIPADFSDYTYISDALLRTEPGLQFQRAVKKLARSVAAKADAAVPFDPNFPIYMPPQAPLPPVPVGLLRLSAAHLQAAGGVI